MGVYFYPRTQIFSFLKWREYTKEGDIFTILPLIIIIIIIFFAFHFVVKNEMEKKNHIFILLLFLRYYYYYFFVSVKLSLQSYYE